MGQESRPGHFGQHGLSDGAHEWITVEGAALIAVVEHADLRPGDERGDGHTPAEPLAEGHDVGPEVVARVLERLPAVERPGPPDARLYLVGDQQEPALTGQPA